MKILIAGGSGLIGARLTNLLVKQGYEVCHLSRKKHRQINAKVFEWKPDENYIDPMALNGTNVVINLAGSNVAAGKWTDKRKAIIRDSRIKSTQCILENIINSPSKPHTLINASAIGIYGNERLSDGFDENANAADGFLSSVCQAWEAEADRFDEFGVRVVKIRIGVVLDSRGGALQKIMMPIKYFIGAPLGSGEQIINWIHVEDLCRIFDFVIKEKQLKGAFNAVAANPVSNTELTRVIASELKRPLWLPNVPGFILKILLGEMSEIVLEGGLVSNKKILKEGFKFKYENIQLAISEIVGQD